MSKLPKIPDTYFTERAGVIAVANVVNQMRCIWRETDNSDIGIDGQIEYVNEKGLGTGHFVAVQVKSGASYLNFDGDDLIYTPKPKHRVYWENFPIPVIVVIWDAKNEIAYWGDARRALRLSLKNRRAIRFPKSQIFDRTCKNKLFEATGVVSVKLSGNLLIVGEMLLSVSSEPQFNINFFDLFVHGLIDALDDGVCRKLFFSMGLCMQIAKMNAKLELDRQGDIKDDPRMFQVTISERIHSFLDQYIRFLVSQNLVAIDLSDYLIDLHDRNMIPMFIYPLTNRGLQLVRFLKELVDKIIEDDIVEISSDRKFDPLKEKNIHIEYENIQEAYHRFGCIQVFKDVILSELKDIVKSESINHTTN
ncbi:DUF4365 domain-containing protein [Anaerolineales bacterium HSG6]|nr:DUF4365 domain-containing protein [Anaerolineales bacterium HSG6]